METFFLSETLKYLWLLFADEEVVDLNCEFYLPQQPGLRDAQLILTIFSTQLWYSIRR